MGRLWARFETADGPTERRILATEPLRALSLANAIAEAKAVSYEPAFRGTTTVVILDETGRELRRFGLRD